MNYVAIICLIIVSLVTGADVALRVAGVPATISVDRFHKAAKVVSICSVILGVSILLMFS